MTVRILHGDCRDVLKTLPAESVHCCVTSPPYWGLRSYLPAGHPDKHKEIGSEPTLQAWVDTMVQVFREVRRVLRDDGTCWVNLGDAYAGSWGAQSREHAGKHAPNVSAISANQVTAAQRKAAGTGSLTGTPGLKAKDIMGQPWRVAFALQDDGWWLRQEIIWAKANPMPESIRDRFTKAHEQVFLLAKSERYYFDFDAVQEPVEGGAHARRPGNKAHKHTAAYEAGDEKARTKAGLVAYAERQREKAAARDVGVGHNARPRKGVPNQGVGHREGPPGNPAPRVKDNDSFDEAMAVMPDMRNPRSVRHIASEPFRGAHYATYPPALIEPFVLAGCPAEVCAACGAPVPPRTTNANEAVRALPDAVQVLPERWRESEVLQQAVRECVDAEDARVQGVRDVCETVHPGSSEPPREVLQQVVRIPLDREASRDDKGPLHDDQGLRDAVPAHTPGRNEGRVRDGAPHRHGEDGRSKTERDGDRAPLERGEGRQPAGEPGIDGEGHARPPAEASDQTDPMPALHGAHKAVWSCACCNADLTGPGAIKAGVCLDPFGGSGTTGLVADRHGRDALLIDLDERNIPMARDRITGDAPLFADVEC